MKATTTNGGRWGRSTTARLAVGLVAFGVLMGAKGEGCLPAVDPGEAGEGDLGEPPPIELCPPGHHSEQICDHDCGDDMPVWEGGGGTYGEGPSTGEGPDGCYEICVPDEPCPAGFYEELVCPPPEPYDPGPCLTQEGCEPPPPPLEECYPVCVPNEEVCPPGTYPDVECNGYGECWEICHPDDALCAPGEVLVVECDANGCYEICLPPPEPTR